MFGFRSEWFKPEYEFGVKRAKQEPNSSGISRSGALPRAFQPCTPTLT